MRTTKILRLVLAGLCAAGLQAAHAFDWKPDGASVQVGRGSNGISLAGAGIVWDWDFQRLRRKAELTAHTEFMVNHWRAGAIGGGHQGVTQLVLLPSLRIRLARGASPWFIELGIGASWIDRELETPHERFGSQWNFYDMLGVGYNLDAEHRHELGLRWVHVSNGGIKRPNPGQDFLQLRYVHRF